MPSDRKVIAFRPDEKEQDIMDYLQEKTGLPMTRILALAVREKAEREGYAARESKQESSKKEDTRS